MSWDQRTAEASPCSSKSNINAILRQAHPRHPSREDAEPSISLNPDTILHLWTCFWCRQSLILQQSQSSQQSSHPHVRVFATPKHRFLLFFLFPAETWVFHSCFEKSQINYHFISTPSLFNNTYFSSYANFLCSCYSQLCVASNCSFFAVTDDSLSLPWLVISQINSLLISAGTPALSGWCFYRSPSLLQFL